MEWIKCSDKTPDKFQECWIYYNNQVLDSDWDHLGSRFILNEEYCTYASIDKVSHWMPYFTPNPPKD